MPNIGASAMRASSARSAPCCYGRSERALPGLTWSLSILPVRPRRRAIDRDVRDRVPGVVDPDEQEEERRRANRKEGRGGVPREREGGRKQGCVRNERECAVPDPVLEHRPVAGLPARAAGDD